MLPQVLCAASRVPTQRDYSAAVAGAAAGEAGLYCGVCGGSVGGFIGSSGEQLYEYGDVRSWGSIGVSALIGGATAGLFGESFAEEAGDAPIDWQELFTQDTGEEVTSTLATGAYEALTLSGSKGYYNFDYGFPCYKYPVVLVIACSAACGAI